jgi:OOP family OmpA-OmpF porin
MKKIILTLIIALAFSTLSAQTEPAKKVAPEFNQWSVELTGGFNKAQRPWAPGYSTSLINPYVADLGVRYMFNNKFGLKADLGYNRFTDSDGSAPFTSKYLRGNIQGVANLGRIMNFETWTNTLGLLAHAGVGLGYVENSGINSGKDAIGNFMGGVTGQIKLSERVALTGDFTTILNANQSLTFDGRPYNGPRGFAGILFNGTVGLTVYIGKNAKHADWVTIVDKNLLALTERVNNLETMLIDSDKDGVADYLDIEKTTISGLMVNTKGKAIDLNNNNVPDAIETYLLANYGNKNDKSPVLSNNELIKSLINGGYIATYFDFNKSTPTNVSTEGIDFILTYLRNNPTASVDIIGHADELGTSAYNTKLSNARATGVKKILVDSKVDSSRLNVIAAGEDTSVDKDSEAARRLVRSVTFRIK